MAGDRFRAVGLWTIRAVMHPLLSILIDAAQGKYPQVMLCSVVTTLDASEYGEPW
jgi:hypothetical protein